MKYYNIIVSITAALSFFTLQNSKADTIADWTFQTSASTNALFARIAAGAGTSVTNIFADIGSGTASGLHASASTAWSSPAGNGSTNSISANNWAVGDYFQFSVGTLGFTNITLSYDQTGSATGPSNFFLAYSTDGSTFTTFGNTNGLLLNGSPNFAWNVNIATNGYNFAYDLSSITALANDSAVYFRIVDATTVSLNGGTVAGGGTGRMDNFIVNGDSIAAVPEPSSMALAAVGGMACLFAVRRKR